MTAEQVSDRPALSGSSRSRLARARRLAVAVQRGCSKPAEPVSRRQRRALHRSAHAGARQIEVDQDDLLDGRILADGGEGELLADVVRTVPQDRAPLGFEPPGVIPEREANPASGHPLRKAGRPRIRGDLLDPRRRDDAHLRGVEEHSRAERHGEGPSRDVETAPVTPIFDGNEAQAAAGNLPRGGNSIVGQGEPGAVHVGAGRTTRIGRRGGREMPGQREQGGRAEADGGSPHEIAARGARRKAR